MPSPEEIEEVMINRYEDFLKQQSDRDLAIRIGHLAIGNEISLTDLQRKTLIEMIQEIDSTGLLDEDFEDMRNNL